MDGPQARVPVLGNRVMWLLKLLGNITYGQVQVENSQFLLQSFGKHKKSMILAIKTNNAP